MNKAHPLYEPSIEELLEECEAEFERKLSVDPASMFHLKSGGSRTRARMCLAIGERLSVPKNDLICLASCIELLHNASLVHDDLQDKDSERRGRPAVWKQFGASRAICSGDMMISIAYGKIADLRSSAKIADVLREVQEAVSETIQGQALDLEASSNINASDYENIAAMKSGPLFRLALSLPLILSNRRDMLNKARFIASSFAIAYQINDDIEDYECDLKSGDLNLVSILSVGASFSDQALNLAKERARYLLRKCQKECAELPKQCAYSVEILAKRMMSSLEETL